MFKVAQTADLWMFEASRASAPYQHVILERDALAWSLSVIQELDP
jgi:hypothetical protein